MFDILKDIVQHTYGLGIIDVVKIVGTEDETSIETIAEDKSVIVQAKMKNPVADFIGTFGMPNLGKLNILLGIPEYKENAKISVTKKVDGADTALSGLHFENATGDFKNDYRFMAERLINEKIRPTKFKGVKWGVDFVPTAANIQRMKFMSQANSEETTFIAKTEGGDLKFYFGDHSSHSGNFVFAAGVTGSISKGYLWPVNVVNNILSLPGDKTFKFSDEGAAMITVDSGMADYLFILPAQQK